MSIYRFKMTKRKRLAKPRSVWCEAFVSEDLKQLIEAARRLVIR